MPANSIFDGPVTNILLVPCILVEVLSRAHVKRGKSRSDFKFGTSVGRFFEWRCGKHGSERVNDKVWWWGLWWRCFCFRAKCLGYITTDMVDEYDPALMFTIPRLAIVWYVMLQFSVLIHVSWKTCWLYLQLVCMWLCLRQAGWFIVELFCSFLASERALDMLKCVPAEEAKEMYGDHQQLPSRAWGGWKKMHYGCFTRRTDFHDHSIFPTTIRDLNNQDLPHPFSA